MTDLARNLRRFRGAQGISSSELARRSDVARATLSALEAGVGNPTVDTLMALAEALGVNVTDLLAEDGRASLSITRASERTVEDTPLRLDFLRRFPLGPCIVDVSLFSLEANAKHHESGHVEKTLIHLIVQRGELDLSTDDAQETLAEGDYACFCGDVSYDLSTGATPVSGTLLLHYAAELAPVLGQKGTGSHPS